MSGERRTIDIIRNVNPHEKDQTGLEIQRFQTKNIIWYGDLTWSSGPILFQIHISSVNALSHHT